MACQVQILSVIGVVPAGATAPAQLRVTGRAQNCPSGNVVVSSSITATSTPQPANLGTTGDGFLVVLPITATGIACSDVVQVTVACDGTSTCQASFNAALPCCTVMLSGIEGEVIPGALLPSQIKVSGTSFNSSAAPFTGNDPVTVSVATSAGTAIGQSTVPADPVDGSFTAMITVPAGTVVQCDDLVAAAASNPGCQTNLKKRLSCPQCARAQLSIAATQPCAGNPATQPILLGATIEIAKGTVAFFRWDFGDGTLSPVFQVDNSAGTATTAHTVPPYTAFPPFPAVTAHNYAPGTYTALLMVTNAQGSPLECDQIPLVVTASCDQCPSLTVSASTPGACANGKRQVTLQTNIISLPSTAPVLYWDFGDNTTGTPLLASATGTWPAPANPAVNVHDYAPNSPNSYTASLIDASNPNCPMQSVQITVPACPTGCCPDLTLQPAAVAGCAPGSVVASFSATLTWMPGCTPTTPSSYDWTLHTASGTKYQKSTSSPSTDTTAGWHDIAGNAVMVQFASGGSCSISVTAVIAGVPAGCNPTDTVAFTVPPCCPQLIGPLNKQMKQGDPCTWLFSAQVSNPNNATVSFEWSFQDGTSATTSQPLVEHTYTPGSPVSGVTTVTLKVAGCPDQSLSVNVGLKCSCPAITKPSGNVTCVAGKATVTLSTSVVGLAATSFAWTVGTPGGKTFSKTTATASTTDGTADGAWTDTGSGATGALDLSKTGGYTVTVVVSGPAISPSCPQPPAGGFSVPDCSGGGGGGGTLSCSIWCTLAGIFLIAVPISAYISTVAHCLLGPPWNIVLQGGIIATAIGIFLALCGECCLWLFLLIGAALGIIATAIASYWLGFPACWYVALPILIGIIALGIGMMIDCSRKSSSSASGSSSASSSSGLSSALSAWVRGRGRGAGEPLAMSAQPALMMEAEGPAAALTAPALTIQQETAAPGVSTAPMAGLGDLVQQVTKAIGIKPCAPCQQRAARLNELIPFRARDPEAGEA